ncbi:MAG: uracil-DNA glycosylase [Candidatus Aureabacteria bacterium]|nr:uracil-DNA glycosylase [Candidatus Auribacterota bacterium]
MKYINEEIKNCRQCRLSETRTNVLCGEGNTDSPLFLIAQAPGEKEDKTGLMFTGPSGRVLDDLLKMAGITRKDVYMTNLVKCMLPKYRKPKPDEIETCTRYLTREIERIKPRVLVPLGYDSIKFVFGKYNSGCLLKSGINPLFGKLQLFDQFKVYSLRHPSALLHNPLQEQEMTRNYRRLGVLLNECKWYPVCPMKTYFEQGRLERKWVELYCKGYWKACVRYKMEEKGESHSDWMLPDGSLNEKLKFL